jgi:hypothetical protein
MHITLTLGCRGTDNIGMQILVELFLLCSTEIDRLGNIRPLWYALVRNHGALIGWVLLDVVNYAGCDGRA